MIIVSQGHEKSISLEVFLKSYLLLSESDQKEITLVCSKESLINNCEVLNIPFKIDNSNELRFILFENIINCNFIGKNDLPESTICLEKSLELIKEGDILLTLPTSKDQLIYKGQQLSGYTEYLRTRFNNKYISMLFTNLKKNTLLMSDHIPLSKVSSFLTSDLIYSKTKTSISGFQKYFYKIDEMIFSGINPHVGENGLLGTEDKNIKLAIDKLQNEFENIKFIGPFAGDTLHKHLTKKNQILVYMYHDQGLPIFKSENHEIGLNVSLGLPFLRMSVDHGTAFDLFGKNEANFLGCNYMINQALEISKRA